MPIRRQLAPTVGPKASGVTFKAGSTGGFGDTLAVGCAARAGSLSYVQDNGTWVPAKDGLIAYTLVPIGGFEIFIGFTPEALGFPRNHTVFGPTRHPVFDYSQDGSESASSVESADSDLHFCGVAGMGPTPSRTSTILNPSFLHSRMMRCQMPDPETPFKSTLTLIPMENLLACSSKRFKSASTHRNRSHLRWQVQQCSRLSWLVPQTGIRQKQQILL